MSTIKELQAYSAPLHKPAVPSAIRVFAEAIGHGKDHVERLRVDEDYGTFYIEFTWFIRGCEQGEDYTVPLEVITDGDVAYKSRAWMLERRIVSAKSEVSSSETRLAEDKVYLSKLEQELDALRNAHS